MVERIEHPRAGEVMIFFSRLDRDPASIEREAPLLSPPELERGARLPDGPARSRFLAGRIFLRNTLARFLRIKAGDILIDEGRWGKPRLSAGMGNGRLSFNLSHSADLALLAVGGGAEVGVDLERIVEGIPLLQMAGIFLSGSELQELESLPASDQLSAFYRCWTRKEAYLKGCGRGLSIPPDSVAVTLLPGAPALLLASASFPEEKERWSICDITAPEGFCAALAVAAKNPVIRYMGH